MNRLVLGFVGVAALAGGAFATTRGWATPGGRAAAVLSPGAWEDPAAHVWYWLAVATVAGLLTLCAASWLACQGFSEVLGALPIAAGRRSRRSAARAVTGAIERGIAAAPGVLQVRARLLRPAGAPRLWLRLTVAQPCDWSALNSLLTAQSLAGMGGEALAGETGAAALREALAADGLPAAVRLRIIAPAGGS